MRSWAFEKKLYLDFLKSFFFFVNLKKNVFEEPIVLQFMSNTVLKNDGILEKKYIFFCKGLLIYCVQKKIFRSWPLSYIYFFN